MRSLILATTLVVLAPVTYAQTTQSTAPSAAAGTPTYQPGTGTDKAGGVPTGSVSTHGGASHGAMTGTGTTGASSRSAMSGQPDPANCGTPDQPKACPPMPRRALSH